MSRYVYYGHELYHAATGQERKNHQYIARIPFGDKFRYFYNQAELAAYKAGKAVGGAANAAGKAISNTANAAGKAVTGAAKKVGYEGEKLRSQINAAKGRKIYENQLKSKNDYMRNPNEKKQQSARAGKTSNPLGYASAVAGRTARDIGDNISKTANAAGRSIDRAVNEVKNFGARNLGTTKGKNSNMHSGNQGYVSKTNASKHNQGIVNTTGKNNSPKSNQGIVSKAFQRYMSKQPTTSDYEPASKGKNNSPKSNQGIDSKAGQRYMDKQKATSDGATAKSDWKKATDSLKNSVKRDNTNLLDMANNSSKTDVANKKSKMNSYNKNNVQKSMEEYYYKQYIKDGHSPAQAKRFAKNAAENYIKKNY